MKKSILNIGKALNKAEQREILGGYRKKIERCTVSSDCRDWQPGPSNYIECLSGVCTHIELPHYVDV